MDQVRQRLALILGIVIGLNGGRVLALPGQSQEEVAAWIQANPTLSPSDNELLIVRKSNTAAQRFEFMADVLPPGKLLATNNFGVIRTERIELFDTINGVSRDRLEESLRIIYGLDIYQDYQQAKIIYTYPSDATVQQSINQKAPLLAARQGELRSGSRYGYWIEVAQPQTGDAVTGKILVLLKEDLDDLETYLRNR
jgi:hypothetical protein